MGACLHDCLYTMYKLCPRRLNNGIRFPGTEVINNYEPLCGCYVCECVTQSRYVHVCAGVPRKQNSQCPIGPELQVDMSCLVRVLGTDIFFLCKNSMSC